MQRASFGLVLWHVAGNSSEQRPLRFRSLSAGIYFSSAIVIGQSVSEETMQNWKKALVCSAVGAGAVLALTGRRKIGIASIAGGLALLASEYPERFEAIWENAPEYVDRASQIFAALSRLSEKFAEDAERRSVDSYEQVNRFSD